MALAGTRAVKGALVAIAVVLFFGLTYQQGAATSQQELQLLKLQLSVARARLARAHGEVEEKQPTTVAAVAAASSSGTDTEDVPLTTTQAPKRRKSELKLITTAAPKFIEISSDEDNGPTSVPSGALDVLPQNHQTRREPQSGDMETLQKHPFVMKVYESVKKAWENPEDETVVHVMVIPVFHDDAELRDLLWSIDAPVRLFAFSWNGNNPDMARTLNVLKLIPYGVVINHFPDNDGFSGAVNAGIREGLTRLPGPPAKWFFIVNADTHFPRGVLPQFARATNELGNDYGLVYGPRQDHFAFVITRAAVRAVGFMDEVFWPGYMEDIDFHWRVMLGGLKKKITRLHFLHKQSANDRKPRTVTGPYQDQLHRSSRGWEYGWMKWGRYAPHMIELERPPSGWTTPFNIPNAPLSLWAVDPGQRECVRTGKGKYHLQSSTCWYNGTVLLAKLPPRTKLSRNLLQPGPSGG